MNILFSDNFAERFAATGNAASRDLLDTGLAGNDQHFWQSVRSAFVSTAPNAVFDELLFMDDPVFSLQSDDIDPSKVVPHEWKKLRTIWKSTHSDYKAALTRFTVSGTHENEFWNFCNGRLEAYYLHKWLALRPNLVAFVEAELPPEAALASTMTGSEIAGRLNSEAGPNKRKRIPIADAIENLASNTGVRADLAREKIRVMKSEDIRQKEHQEWKKSIETKRAELDAENTLLTQWEMVVANIRQLKKDLLAPNLSDEDKEDIHADIKGFKMRKHKLALKLGIRDE